jgi:hypothetical protein
MINNLPPKTIFRFKQIIADISDTATNEEIYFILLNFVRQDKLLSSQSCFQKWGLNEFLYKAYKSENNSIFFDIIRFKNAMKSLKNNNTDIFMMLVRSNLEELCGIENLDYLNPTNS